MKFTGIENYKYWRELMSSCGFGCRDIHRIAYGFEKRNRHIKIRGYAILTKETLKALTDIVTGYNVLDVGAGTGYMSFHLRKNNISIDGVVDNKYRYGFKRNRMTKWLIKANYLELDISKYNAFLFSWPDYISPDAKKFLDRMKSGDKLIYQGEWEGGCCADDDFFDTLEGEFKEVYAETKALNKYHVQFAGIHDTWTVYIKR